MVILFADNLNLNKIKSRVLHKYIFIYLKTFSNSANTFAPIAPNLKKCPQLKTTFSNSTNKFAPIAPNLKKMPPIVKKMPPIKKHFQIPLTPLLPFPPI